MTGLQKKKLNKSLVIQYYPLMMSIYLTACFLSIRTGFVFIVGAFFSFQDSQMNIKFVLALLIN